MATMLAERYSSAVHSRGLAVDEKTTYSDTDVLGSYGLAARNLERGHDQAYERGAGGRSFTPAPLAVPLARLFAGDHKAAHEVVRILADAAMDQSYRMHIRIGKTQAHDMACATLAWFRNGTCLPCGGRGKPTLKDSPVQSAQDCDRCGGTGKIKFEANFRYEWKPLALWLKEKMNEECGRAGPEAMKMIAARMEL